MGSLIISADQEWPRVVESGQGAAMMPDDHHLVDGRNGMGKESNCVGDSYKCGAVAEVREYWDIMDIWGHRKDRLFKPQLSEMVFSFRSILREGSLAS